MPQCTVHTLLHRFIKAANNHFWKSARLWLCTVCSAVEVNTHVSGVVINVFFSFFSLLLSHQPSSFNLWKHQHLGRGKRKVIFFSSTACHRWWESLCNANIISHCVGLALQFALFAKQPGCGVIYHYVEKKTSLRLRRMATWSPRPATRPAATGPAFTLLIPRPVRGCVLLINLVY